MNQYEEAVMPFVMGFGSLILISIARRLIPLSAAADGDDLVIQWGACRVRYPLASIRSVRLARGPLQQIIVFLGVLPRWVLAAGYPGWSVVVITREATFFKTVLLYSRDPAALVARIEGFRTDFNRRVEASRTQEAAAAPEVAPPRQGMS